MLYQLPEDSRTVGHIRGGVEHIGWTGDRYISATTVDILNQILYVLISTNSKKKPNKPKPIPTPQSRQRNDSDNPFAAQLKAQFDKLKEG